MPKLRLAALVAAAFVSATSLIASAQAETLVGLTKNNRLLLIDGATGHVERELPIAGASFPLLGLARRPSDDRLYGFDSTSRIYRIDVELGGLARLVSNLHEPVMVGAPKALIAFNPVTDRLTIVGVNGVNVQVDVDTGEAVKLGKVRFQPNDANQDKVPTIVAGAYSNPVKGARDTTLYDIDAYANAIAVQEPVMNGTLATKAKLGFEVNRDIVFDIGANGKAYAVQDSHLYVFDPETGKVQKQKTIVGLNEPLIDIAALAN